MTDGIQNRRKCILHEQFIDRIGATLHSHTHPCCVLSQIAATVLNSVGVAQLLEELDFLDDILPFLENIETSDEYT